MSEEVKRGRGRPKSDNPRDNTHHLRMNDDEAALLSSLADRLGVSKSEAIRDSIKTRMDILDKEERIRTSLVDFSEKLGVTEEEAMHMMLNNKERDVVYEVEFTEEEYQTLCRISTKLGITKEEVLDRAVDCLYELIFGKKENVDE